MNLVADRNDNLYAVGSQFGFNDATAWFSGTHGVSWVSMGLTVDSTVTSLASTAAFIFSEQSCLAFRNAQLFLTSTTQTRQLVLYGGATAFGTSQSLWETTVHATVTSLSYLSTEYRVTSIPSLVRYTSPYQTYYRQIFTATSQYVDYAPTANSLNVLPNSTSNGLNFNLSGSGYVSGAVTSSQSSVRLAVNSQTHIAIPFNQPFNPNLTYSDLDTGIDVIVGGYIALTINGQWTVESANGNTMTSNGYINLANGLLNGLTSLNTSGSALTATVGELVMRIGAAPVDIYPSSDYFRIFSANNVQSITATSIVLRVQLPSSGRLFFACWTTNNYPLIHSGSLTLTMSYLSPIWTPVPNSLTAGGQTVTWSGVSFTFGFVNGSAPTNADAFQPPITTATPTTVFTAPEQIGLPDNTVYTLESKLYAQMDVFSFSTTFATANGVVINSSFVPWSINTNAFIVLANMNSSFNILGAQLNLPPFSSSSTSTPLLTANIPASTSVALVGNVQSDYTDYDSGVDLYVGSTIVITASASSSWCFTGVDQVNRCSGALGSGLSSDIKDGRSTLNNNVVSTLQTYSGTLVYRIGASSIAQFNGANDYAITFTSNITTNGLYTATITALTSGRLYLALWTGQSSSLSGSISVIISSYTTFVKGMTITIVPTFPGAPLFPYYVETSSQDNTIIPVSGTPTPSVNYSIVIQVWRRDFKYNLPTNYLYCQYYQTSCAGQTYNLALSSSSSTGSVPAASSTPVPSSVQSGNICVFVAGVPGSNPWAAAGTSGWVAIVHASVTYYASQVTNTYTDAGLGTYFTINSVINGSISVYSPFASVSGSQAVVTASVLELSTTGDGDSSNVLYNGATAAAPLDVNGLGFILSSGIQFPGESGTQISNFINIYFAIDRATGARHPRISGFGQSLELTNSFITDLPGVASAFATSSSISTPTACQSAFSAYNLAVPQLMNPANQPAVASIMQYNYSMTDICPILFVSHCCCRLCNRERRMYMALRILS